MTEDLQPRCERCRHWRKTADRGYGKCTESPELTDVFTLPGDFCSRYTPKLSGDE